MRKCYLDLVSVVKNLNITRESDHRFNHGKEKNASF
uniref:Uncharacterized protein n=1 Tax=Anguilla anguilla TaxID=7936 RepID=A0A0E9P5B1_ANGAN